MSIQVYWFEEFLAKRFHEIYESLAPEFGYETREETRDFDKNSPNGKLMIATCREIINEFGMKIEHRK